MLMLTARAANRAKGSFRASRDDKDSLTFRAGAVGVDGYRASTVRDRTGTIFNQVTIDSVRIVVVAK